LLGGGVPSLDAAVLVDSKGWLGRTEDNLRETHNQTALSAFGSPAVLGPFVF
jgi:hypothetical protein